MDKLISISDKLCKFFFEPSRTAEKRIAIIMAVWLVVIIVDQIWKAVF